MHSGGIHLIDLILWLSKKKIIEVNAFSTKIVTKNCNFRYPDCINAQIKFEDGAIGNLIANFPSVIPHGHRLVIHGEKVHFIMGHLEVHTFSQDPSATPIIKDIYPGVRKGDMLYSFLDSILKSTKPEVTKNEVFDAMNVSLAIEESLKQGKTIKNQLHRFSMNIPFGKPIIEEEEKSALMEVLNSPILVHGPKAIQFEKDFAEFTGADTAISVSSCTAGMHLIYFALGIGKGDEVIVPAQTHVATAHAVELVGAKAVFVDVFKDSGNINPNLVKESITSRTKAIAVVHYLGVPAAMEEIVKIAEEHNLFVLEDCALSPGAKIDNKHTGLLGDAGVFSFYPIKHLTTAEGGNDNIKNKKIS